MVLHGLANVNTLPQYLLTQPLSQNHKNQFLRRGNCKAKLDQTISHLHLIHNLNRVIYLQYTKSVVINMI